MKKFVIFDLDGTLLNTIADLGNACNHALKEAGFSTHPLSAYNYMVGNGVRKLLERAQPDAGPEVIDAMLASFREYYDRHCTDMTKPYPGVPELLLDLRDRDIAIAVTSNKYQKAVDAIVRHYLPDIEFATILGEVPDRPKKPDPSSVFQALSDHPCPKRDVLYCGDSAVDMETARRACVESAGVTWGFRSRESLEAAGAEYLADTPEELEKVILGA